MKFLALNNDQIQEERRIEALGGFWRSKDVFVRRTLLKFDKNTKENFSNINTLEIHEKLTSTQSNLGITKKNRPDVRNLGPTAQDFHAVFEVNGDDNIHISSLDTQGVALTSIQGLNEKKEKLMVENVQLHANSANLEACLSSLESKGQAK